MVFAGNFAHILHPGVLALGALGHTWSLAVEEQFYLLWPALFVLLMRCHLSRSRLALSLSVVAIAEMVYRGVMAHADYSHARIYYGTDTHSDGLLIGCAIAFWLASDQSSWLKHLPGALRTGASWLGATVLLILFAFGDQASAPVEIAVAVLASGAMVTGIVLGGFPAGLRRLLGSKHAVSIGRRSYGLYLWHVIIFAAAEAFCAPFTGIFPAGLGERRIVFSAALVTALAVSFIVTELSYHFVELPVLRVKRRFQGEAG
jgi:peptidoglycan/LPS O-acetylase OafA/YrhL